MPLRKLTARHTDQLYTAMASSGSGPLRVRCARVVLHRAVAQAVRWDWLARNPVSAATRPPVPSTTITPPEAAGVRSLLAAAERRDPVLACWLHVAVATGARRGEVCALRWSDVDLAAATVRIERSVSATKSAGMAIRPTKTGRVRLVSLTASAVERLLRHRAPPRNCPLPPVEESRPTTRSSPVIHRAAGRWRPELLTRRWERLRATCGLGRMRIHDLRHFVATQLLTAGIDVRTVANRFGHARTSTTLDIYWAWVPSRDRDAARHLEALLG